MHHSTRLIITVAFTTSLIAGLTLRTAAQQPAFHRVDNWAHVPAGFAWGEIGDAEFDAEGHLWVLHRPPTPGSSSDPRKGGGEVPVLMFDASGTLVKSFGKGLMLEPHGLHIDPEGNIWVTDCGPFYAAGQTPGKGFQIFKFTPDGKLLMTLGKAGVDTPGPTTFRGPTDVVVNARGEIFVADGHTPRPGPNTGDRIVKLAKDGTFIKAWGIGPASKPDQPAKPGDVYGPHRLAIDSQGRLFLADRGNRRIQIFDQNGTFLDQWTQFGTPSGISIDKSDTLYIAVAGGERSGVRIVDAKTGMLKGSIDGISPEVAVADRQGHIYAGLVAGQELLQFAPGGR